jgi:hypothetical protein
VFFDANQSCLYVQLILGESMIIGHRPSPFCSGSFKLDSKGTILGNVIKIRNPSSNGWGAEEDIFLSLAMHMTLQCAMESGREV